MIRQESYCTKQAHRQAGQQASGQSLDKLTKIDHRHLDSVGLALLKQGPLQVEDSRTIHHARFTTGSWKSSISMGLPAGPDPCKHLRLICIVCIQSFAYLANEGCIPP